MREPLLAVTLLLIISLIAPQPAFACAINHETLAVLLTMLLAGLIYVVSLVYFAAFGGFRIWKQTKQNNQAIRDGACLAEAQQLLSTQKKSALRSVILYPLRNAIISSIIFLLTMTVWPH